MPAARYWRAVGLQSVGGGALELSELHLYRGGVRVDEAATLTSAFAPDSGALASLQDADTATSVRWLDVSAPAFALVWDFGSIANAKDVRAVRLGAGALYSEWLETLTLQYSYDGIGWVTLGSIKAFTWAGAGTMQSVPADGDPDFDKVSLLLHCDGVNGSTVFTDSSAAPKEVTAYGNARVSTAQSRWGGASLQLDGSGDALSVAVSDSLQFGSADFTIEFWLRTSKAIQTNDYPRILSVGRYLTNGGWNLVYLKASGAVYLDFYAAGATSLSMFCGTVVDDTWTYVAIARNGSTVRAFLNGIPSNSSPAGAVLNATDNLVVGAEHNMLISNFAGCIDDLRITKGLGRPTGDSTPPPAPFTNMFLGEAGSVPMQPLLRASAPDRARIAVASSVPPHSIVSVPRLTCARDIEFGGPGRIYGTTKIQSSPTTKVPAKARVSILRGHDKLLAREVWSDPVTGEWEAKGLDTRQDFVVLAQDSAGNYQPVAADKTLPEAP